LKDHTSLAIEQWLLAFKKSVHLVTC